MRFELQRADFWKRISAFLFDIIMLATLAVGIAALLSVILRYDMYIDVIDQVEAEYADKYGVDPDISKEDFDALTDEQKAPYIACDEARQKDERLIIAYNMAGNLLIAITSASIVLSSLIMELIVPIFFKNGQTLGKKIFGLAVVHTNGVRLHGQAHFIRAVIGKCAIETMVPVYILMMVFFGDLGIVGAIVLALILILQIVCVASTKTRSAIHDLISDTAVVDYQSQMIFETADDFIAYKTKIHEEEVAKKEY